MTKIEEKRIKHIKFDEFDKILISLEKQIDYLYNNPFAELPLAPSLSIKDKYAILVKSIENNSLIFPFIENELNDVNFYEYVLQSLMHNLDDDLIAHAIRNSNIDIHIFEQSKYLNATINIFMIKTINFLFEKAESAGCWEYLLQLGYGRSKKALLHSIIKSNDQQIIEKFFDLYRKDPEIEHLTPFI